MPLGGTRTSGPWGEISPRFAGAERERQERLAKKLLKENNVQDHLKREFDGAFVWKVEQFPHWLNVVVDRRNTTPEQLRAWIAGHREKLQAFFESVLKPHFPEVYVRAENWRRSPSNAGCCGTGCAGCLIQKQKDAPGPDSKQPGKRMLKIV